MHLLEPTSFAICVTGPSIRERVLAATAGENPAVGVEVEIGNWSLRLTHAQLQDVADLVTKTVEADEAIRAREISLLLADRVPRPAARDALEMGAARARWQYAIGRVRLELEWRKGWRVSPSFFGERRRVRTRYMALYRKTKGVPLTGGGKARTGGKEEVAEALKEMQLMERDKLTADDIFAFRSLAEAEILNERTRDAQATGDKKGGLFAKRAATADATKERRLSGSSTTSASPSHGDPGGGAPSPAGPSALAGKEARKEARKSFFRRMTGGLSSRSRSASGDTSADEGRARVVTLAEVAEDDLEGGEGMLSRIAETGGATGGGPPARMPRGAAPVEYVDLGGDGDSICGDSEYTPSYPSGSLPAKPLAYAASASSMSGERPAFDEYTSRYVAELVAGDDDETISQSGSLSGLTYADSAMMSAGGDALDELTRPASKRRKPVEHTVKVALRSLRATMLISEEHELLHVNANQLLCAVKMRATSVRAGGTLGSLEILDRNAEHGTLAHTLLQLPRLPHPADAPEGSPADVTVDEQTAAVAFEFRTLPPNQYDAAELDLHVRSRVDLVCAPLLLSRLADFIGTVSDIPMAMMMHELRAYMRRHMWAGAKSSDLLTEVISAHKHTKIGVDLAGLRVLLSDQLADINAAVAVLECGPTTVRSISPAPDETVATPAAAANVAAKSLKHLVNPDEIAPVRSVLYDRFGIDVASMRILLVRPEIRKSEGRQTARVSYAVRMATRSRELMAVARGVELDLSVCVLPPGSHNLPQANIDITLRTPASAFAVLRAPAPSAVGGAIGAAQRMGAGRASPGPSESTDAPHWESLVPCNSSAAVAPSATSSPMQLIDIRSTAKALQAELLGTERSDAFGGPAERRLTSGAEAMAMPPATRKARAKSCANSCRTAPPRLARAMTCTAFSAAAVGDAGEGVVAPHQERHARALAQARQRHAKDLARVRATSIAAGVHEAVRCLQGDALVMHLSADDLDALDAIVEAVIVDTTRVRKTFSGSEGPPAMRATWSAPHSAEVQQTVSALSAPDEQGAGRMEIRLTVPGLKVNLVNESTNPVTGMDRSGAVDDELMAVASVDEFFTTCIITDELIALDFEFRSLALDDVESPLARKPARAAEAHKLDIKLIVPEYQKPDPVCDVTILLSDTSIAWMRDSLEQLMSYKLPQCMLPRLQPFLDGPALATIVFKADRTRICVYDEGVRKLALDLQDLYVKKFEMPTEQSVVVALRRLKMHDLEGEPQLIFASDRPEDIVVDEEDGANADDGAGKQNFVKADMFFPSVPSLFAAEAAGDGPLRGRVKLRVKPFTSIWRKSALKSTRDTLYGECMFFLEQWEAMGLVPDLVAMFASFEQPPPPPDAPTLDIEVLGASACVLLDERESGGVLLKLSKVMVSDLPADNAPPTAGEAPPLRVQVDGLQLRDVRPGQGSMTGGPVMLHEDSIALSISPTETVSIIGGGKELTCEASLDQIKRLVQLSEVIEPILEPLPSSTPPSEAAAAPPPKLRLRLHFDRIALGLSGLSLRGADAALLSTMLLDIDVDMKLADGTAHVTGGLGSWEARGGALATLIAHSRRVIQHEVKSRRPHTHDAMLESTAAEAVHRGQVLRAKLHATDLEAADGKLDARIDLGCCRVSLAERSRGCCCVCFRRLCALWLPLVRLACLMLCVLRPVRILLAHATPLACEFACCVCCAAPCARIGRWLCTPRVASRGRARTHVATSPLASAASAPASIQITRKRPPARSEEGPSIQLLSVEAREPTDRQAAPSFHGEL